MKPVVKLGKIPADVVARAAMEADQVTDSAFMAVFLDQLGEQRAAALRAVLDDALSDRAQQAARGAYRATNYAILLVMELRRALDVESRRIEANPGGTDAGR